MLLNLSNHPSAKWSETQQAAAEARYSKVEDLPFPNIDPNWTEAEVQRLAEEYLEQVIQMAPTAVHIMGEMTFTYTLVRQLMAAGIPCLASTTERIVSEEEGKKVVQFKFVQFRRYEP